MLLLGSDFLCGLLSVARVETVMSDKFCHLAECAVSWCCSDSPALPLQQMLPAKGSCQLTEAGLSSKTLVYSFPLNFAAVIKWKSELSGRTEFYCSLYLSSSFQNPLEKFCEKSFLFREKLETFEQIVRVV